MNRKEQLCIEILQNCRTQLYCHFPYLDGAFASIGYQCDPQETSIRIDGNTCFFSVSFLMREYIRKQKRIVRGYLHMLMHCLFLHPWMELPGEELFEQRLWNLSCDITVEVLIEQLLQDDAVKDELMIIQSPKRQEMVQRFMQEHFSVQQIYQNLRDRELREELSLLEEEFSFDDHRLWQEIEEETKEKMKQKWKNISLYSGDRKGRSAAPGISPGQEVEMMDEFTKSRYDYHMFLKQFSILREEVELDLDSFDYIYYHLGMDNYQNMPLIEPLEYKEVNRLEELVIAIDTSSSCSTETVQQFLSETYQMLSQKENFFRRMKVYLIQCDTHIEDVVVIHSEEEWKDYSRQIKIIGRGGTDFRPVFRYVADQQEKKEIRSLKGLIYFTDGDGVFPKEKPAYETAFVFLREKAKLDYVPSWAQVLLI